MNTVQYPAPIAEAPAPATLVVRGSTCAVSDANLAAAVGAGNSAHFTAAFDIVIGRGPASQHLHFAAGSTHVLAPEVKAALLAAGAPMTVL
jgi:hypothetical protein